MKEYIDLEEAALLLEYQKVLKEQQALMLSQHKKGIYVMNCLYLLLCWSELICVAKIYFTAYSCFWRQNQNTVILISVNLVLTGTISSFFRSFVSFLPSFVEYFLYSVYFCILYSVIHRFCPYSSGRWFIFYNSYLHLNSYLQLSLSTQHNFFEDPILSLLYPSN